MGAFTLLIADSDENFRRALFLALQDRFYICTCETGAQALSLLRTSTVHILVVDLMLPEIDGLTLVQTLLQECICPDILAVAPILPPDPLLMEELDIRHFLRKPCPVQSTVAQVLSLRQELEQEGLLPRRTRQILRQLHICPKYDGYDSLLHALPALAEDPKLTITKHLYADTAQALGCKAENVEHNIREAIGKTWDNFPSPLWREFFPNHKDRPSNGDFLQRVALELRKYLE